MNYFVVHPVPEDTIQIMTNCQEDSNSTNGLVIELCQNGKCCTSDVLSGQGITCQLNEYIPNELGDCGTFDFVNDTMKATVTLSNDIDTDNWLGEWIKVVLKSGIAITCPISQVIGGEGNPRSLENLDCYLPSGI